MENGHVVSASGVPFARMHAAHEARPVLGGADRYLRRDMLAATQPQCNCMFQPSLSADTKHAR